MNNSMNFNEFKEMLTERIKLYLPASFKDDEIVFTEIVKQNYSYTGMILRKPAGEPESTIRPILNINLLYDDFNANKLSVHEIMGVAAQLLIDAPEGINIDEFLVYENVKDKLYLKVCDITRNEELIDSVPHMSIDEIAATVNVELSYSDGRIASYMVTNKMLQQYGIDENTLFEDALESCEKRKPYIFKTIREVIIESLCESGSMTEEEAEGYLGLDNLAEDFMYVLTNEGKLHGASVIFYPGVLEHVADILDSSYYIIPSSIHELIIIPDDGHANSDILNSMITEVNGSEVDPSEILSYECYYYNRNTKTIGKAINFSK